MFTENNSMVKNAKVSVDASVGPFCIVGFPPESRGVYPESPFGVELLDGCVLHGHNTVDAGTERNTVIGKGVWLMKGVHVGHDAIIGQNATLACHALIGGFVEIGEGANIGLGAIIHQRVKVPPYCMIGMGCVVTKTTPLKPFTVWVGSPARFLKFNAVGIEKAGLTQEEVDRITADWLNHNTP